MDNTEAPQIQQAVQFFTDTGLVRLLTLLRQKYIDQDGVAGTVNLRESTRSERENIASLLAKPLAPIGTVKVPLVAIDKALQQSGFHCTLPELLSAFFPDQPLITKREQRERQSARHTHFYQRLQAIALALPDAAPGRTWLLQGMYGLNWLFSRYKRLADGEPAPQEQYLSTIRYIASTLNQLPASGSYERLALFAQRTSGDPHALDRNREAGRLFLYALKDLISAPEAEKRMPQSRAAVIKLYDKVGLLIDGISSDVTVSHLAHALYPDGTHDPLIQAAGGRVLKLPLRQLLDWQACAASSLDVYLVENPQVFEELEAALSTIEQAPTLVCTSGWPGAAVYRLLQQLLDHTPELCLHYSGDFDLKGLQIAATLLKRYPHNCQLWHFDPHAYAHALQFDGVAASAPELAMLNKLPDLFASLVTAIQKQGKWAYQEGIVRLLISDLLLPGEKLPEGTP